ncbi:MAG: hypothetical protein ACOC1P_05585 [Minisyncoccales bacterium]
MPLPKKRSSESEEEFMQRCMSNSQVRREFDFQQAQGYCMEQARGGEDNKEEGKDRMKNKNNKKEEK